MGTVVIKTKEQSDTIRITVGADNKLTAYINGMSHKLPFSANGEDQYLVIRTGAGNDRISIDSLVKINVTVNAGKGDDMIHAGGGQTSIFGGPGKDYICMGSGIGVAHGGDGDDVMIAGAGHASMSGGDGSDKLYAMYPSNSLRQVYLNGDNGADTLYAGSGINVLNGGLGDDTLFGHHQTTFYTGAGKNTVNSYSAKDSIYAKNADVVHNSSGASVTQVEYAESGRKAFKIDGSPSFIARVEAYIEQLRGSPTGQQMLKTMDELASKNGAAVTIKQSEFLGVNRYLFRTAYTDNLPEDEYLKADPSAPEFGHIKDGTAGSTATHAELHFHTDTFDSQFLASPLVTLYHEMAHAFNGATGTFMPGSKTVVGEDGVPFKVANAEYQAVGLATDGLPFDFDSNPVTAPTTTNPAPFSENGIKAEMGLPLRTRYA